PAVIRPSRTNTAASRPAAPVPSTTSPPRITRSSTNKSPPIDAIYWTETQRLHPAVRRRAVRRSRSPSHDPHLTRRPNRTVTAPPIVRARAPAPPAQPRGWREVRKGAEPPPSLLTT